MLKCKRVFTGVVILLICSLIVPYVPIKAKQVAGEESLAILEEDVSFSNDDDGDSLVEVRKDDYAIAWNITAEEEEKNSVNGYSLKNKVYDMKGKKKANVKDADLSDYTNNEKKLFAKKIQSRVAYENLFNSAIDIEYTLSSNSVKEDIILHEPTNINSYVMELSVKDLVPILKKDNSIVFFNEKEEEIFTMPTPFMFDANDEYSTDIKVALEQNGSKYLLKLTPNQQWLRANERQYPITIDPTLNDDSPNNTSSNVRDTYVVKDSIVKNNMSSYMYTGLKNGKIHRSYIRYVTMPRINGTITSATMNITATSGTSTYGPISIYQVNNYWDSPTITWANQPSTTDLKEKGVRSGFKFSFDVLETVKKWYSGNVNGGNANYGFSIRYSDEYYKDYNNFYTSESSNVSGRPSLLIEYIQNTPVNYISFPSSYSMYVNKSTYLTASVYPIDASNRSVTYTSSNSNVVSVNSSTGYITAKNWGTARIIARSNADPTIVVSCTVTVYQYVTTVRNYYDLGYNIRYNETEAETKQNISNYTTRVANRYGDLLGLKMIRNTPTYYRSALDLCKGTVTNLNIDTLCRHGNNINHSDFSEVSSNFKNSYPGSDIINNAFWTAHRIECKGMDGSIEINRPRSKEKNIFMLSIHTPETRERDTCALLMHELNHQYGVGDHYHEIYTVDGKPRCKSGDRCSECGKYKRDERCIMNRIGQNVSLSTIMCSDSKADMKTHLEGHHKPE